MGKKKAYKTIFLNYQAIISGQDTKDEAGHLGSLLSLLPSHVPSPYLSAYQEICLLVSQNYWDCVICTIAAVK